MVLGHGQVAGQQDEVAGSRRPLASFVRCWRHDRAIAQRTARGGSGLANDRCRSAIAQTFI